ncbi:hypothetical protein RF007C_10545 [Ruminococcus flavefaciens 007c]|uniref:Uncharacterized protein n=1 Tax=Ruminococcus flavefaciens 007c TaxID=1341157 RepID=W7UUC9_RUMFL|nr:hypothetical protein RF007C_10545 [Ruminococcus flavefaciens 007c]
MKYILLQNTFLKKLMELFSITTATFLIILRHILFKEYLPIYQIFNIAVISTFALYK